MASTDAVEEALNRMLKIKSEDATAMERSVAFVRTQWREMVKRVSGLEMTLANEKLEMFEDPLVVHEMHVACSRNAS